jgi:hypothetical protein
MDVKNISISDFVRYILIGFNFLLLVVIFPLMYLQSNLLSLFLSNTSFGIVTLLCISLGYIIDILKLYQYSPGYKSRLKDFAAQISNELGIPDEEVGSYLSLVSKIWNKQSPYDLERRKSEWVFAFDTAVILIMSIFVWVIVATYHFIFSKEFISILTPALAILLSIILTIRLYKAGNHEVRRSNKDIFLILKANKAKIQSSWHIKEE